MIKWLKRLATIVVIILLTVFAVRAVDSQRGAPLALWQTFVPHELDADQIAKASWSDYIAAEDAIRAEIKTEVSDRLPADQCTPANRYCPTSPLYTPKFATDWNRSFVLEPAGAPVGVVVLLHGLTDSPYSLRHTAESYRANGWLAIGIRMPGHGTVPAGLTTVHWEQWRAATRLAVREARRRIGAGKPLHIVGYSNGGALAVDYALDALGDKNLPRADRIVLMSPMIEITPAARFSGIAGWPAILPAFAKAAWLDLLPEYNPFKYNSFPVNAARESFAVTRVVQRSLERHAADGSIRNLPPILTFQSVVDATVVMSGVVDQLYRRLPANGSELVLFDLNRNAVFGPLIRPRAAPDLARLLPAVPRSYGVAIVGNGGGGNAAVVRVTPANATAETVVPLAEEWPAQVFSLSHIAVPFPVSDGLYGLAPDPADDFGIQLGSMAVRGERGVLIVTPDMLLRISSNPFYPYMAARIAAGMATQP